ncbi:MAG: diguanylate cyclase [Methanomassiliicoccales archaeon]
MKLDSIAFNVVLNNLTEGVYFVDKKRRISYWNHGAEAITGYKGEEVIDSYCCDNILMHVDDDGHQLCQDGCPIQDTLIDGQERRRNVYLHHRDGKRVPVWLITMPLFDEQGNLTGAAEIFGENTARIQVQERMRELEQMAYLDALTGVANRRYIEIMLNSRLHEFLRYEWSFGVLFIDIDNFKLVNDTYGHEIGDQVLKMVAGTLEANIRVYDRIGRWGGEEFVIILTNVQEAMLQSVAEKIRHLVQQSSIQVDGINLGVTVSIGATMVGGRDTTAEGLIKRADELMYQSKKAGRNQVTLG